MAKLPASVTSEGLLRWRNVYAAGTEYSKNDGVSSGGSSYVSRVDHNIGNTPATSPTQWEVLSSPGTGADKFYEHKQEVASAEWKIPHKLGKKPSILVMDNGNNEIEGDISYPSLEEAVVKFAAVFPGTAYCN